MISAIALDDEPPALEIIKSFCGRIDSIDLKKVFTKTGEAFDYLEKSPVDLLLLDINMPSITGIDFYKKLSNEAMVIFTTSYSEYAVESYNLNALDYLVKPFTFKRFFQAIEKASEFHKLRQHALQSEQDFITLRVDYGLVKLPVAPIDFIEGLDNYLKIHSSNKKPVVVRMTMKALLEKLPSPAFIRVHRSYIVPLGKVATVRNKIITLSCGEEIPLGSSYEQEFMRFFGH